MQPRLPRVGNARTEHHGLAILKGLVTASPPDGLGFLFRELPDLDYGIDGQIEIVETSGESAFVTGKLVSVQVKSGSSYFEHFDNGAWLNYISKTTVNYWRSHSIPVLFVLVDVDKGEAYWARGDSEDHTETEAAYRIRVSKHQRVDGRACDAIRELAEHTTEEGRRLARLEADLPLIAATERGKPVFVDLAQWQNKSSGRVDYWIGVSGSRQADADGPRDLISFSSGSAYGFGGDPLSAAQFITPWASPKVDDDHEETSRERLYDEYLIECGTYDNEDGAYVDSTGTFDSWIEKRRSPGADGVIAYYEDGEVSRYRLLLELNDLGEAYLRLRAFLKGTQSSSSPKWPPG
jgi:hypothetical protein